LVQGRGPGYPNSYPCLPATTWMASPAPSGHGTKGQDDTGLRPQSSKHCGWSGVYRRQADPRPASRPPPPRPRPCSRAPVDRQGLVLVSSLPPHRCAQGQGTLTSFLPGPLEGWQLSLLCRSEDPIVPSTRDKEVTSQPCTWQSNDHGDQDARNARRKTRPNWPEARGPGQPQSPHET
jgi:hypothetical protein